MEFSPLIFFQVFKQYISEPLKYHTNDQYILIPD